jgi:hypothetical protein
MNRKLLFLIVCLLVISTVIFFIVKKFYNLDSNKIKNVSIFNEKSQPYLISVQDINSGITILGRVSIFNDSGYYSPNFDIIVLNHTDESISFVNKGFGLEIYWGDGYAKVWRRIELNPSPESTLITLDPHTEKWVGDNMWILNGSNIKEFYRYHPVRVYVFGVGEISGKEYMAYWDVTEDQDIP